MSQFVRVLFIASAKDDPTWPVVQATAKRFAEKYPLTAIDVDAPGTRSPKIQQDLLNAARTREANVVCIMPNDPAAVQPIVSNLSLSGIPVITVGTDIPGARRDVYCGPSELDIGRKCAAACGQILERRSKTVMLLHAGEEHPVYGARLLGFRESTRLHGPIEILRDINGHNDAMRSFRLMKAEARRYPRIGCWVLLDDWPLRTIGDAERLLPLGVTMVLCDAEPRHWNRLRDGQVQALIGYDVQVAIEEAMFRAIRVARGEISDMTRETYIPAEIITDKELPRWEARWAAWREGLPTP